MNKLFEIPRIVFMKTGTHGYPSGFNGKENDNEIKGVGNQQDYGFRIYDTRLGKFLSVDPLTKDYPWYTPYQFAGNKPTTYIDLDGLEEARIDAMYRNTYKAAKTLYPDDAAKRQAYIDQAGKDRAIGAALGSVAIFTEFAPVLARLGYTTAAVSCGISIAKGDNAYEVIKSTYSGFYGGAALGLGGSAVSLIGLAGKGAVSGLVGEATNQVFDNAFGNADGSNLGRLVYSGAIGSIANIFSSKLVENVNDKVQQRVITAIAQTETEVYRNTIQKVIQTETPGIGNQSLKKAVNMRIGTIQSLIKSQGEQLKAGLKQVIERGTDVLQDRANEK